MRYNGEDWRFLQWRAMLFSEFLWNVWQFGAVSIYNSNIPSSCHGNITLCRMVSRRNLSVFLAPNMCLRRQIFNVVCQRSAFWLLRPKLTGDQRNLGVFLKFLGKFLSLPTLTPNTDRAIFCNEKPWSDLERGGFESFFLRTRCQKWIFVIISTTFNICGRMTVKRN
jgi:hypothetical protein